MKNLGERLNGWQRLWIVCGVIYLAIVAGVSISSIPRALTINEYFGETVDGGDIVPRDTARYVRLDKKWVQVEQIAKNDKTGEFIYMINGKWSEPASSLEYAKIPHELSNDETWLLRKKQATFIAVAFIYWLVPWLLSYLSGLAVVWIINGFRDNQT